MLSRGLVFVVALMCISFYMIGCPGGGKGNSPPPPPSPAPLPCSPGQICGGGIGGTALLNSPAIGFLDSDPQPSTIILEFAAVNPVAGQAYSGQVNIVGTLNLPRGCGYNVGGVASVPPGSYPVQGQGIWQSGPATAHVGDFQALLQMNGGLNLGQIDIRTAWVVSQQHPQDPGRGQGNYIQAGYVIVPACGRAFTAL